MTRYRSDCWDSGNSMTRFYEVHAKCQGCGSDFYFIEGRYDGDLCDACEEKLETDPTEETITTNSTQVSRWDKRKQ